MILNFLLKLFSFGSSLDTYEDEHDSSNHNELS